MADRATGSGLRPEVFACTDSTMSTPAGSGYGLEQRPLESVFRVSGYVPSPLLPEPVLHIINTVRTCTPCRIKKMKCDGVLGQCGACSRARMPMNCVYNEELNTVNERKEPLRRGEACVPCRRKKKRCNAVRPACDTCSIAEKPDGCVYNDTSTLTRWRGSTAAGSQNASPHAARPEYPPRILNFTDSLHSFPPVLLRNPDLHLRGLLHSGKSPSDVNSIFRQRFLQCRQSAGFRFTSAKREAILRGDLSHTIIHPFFIHFAHMFGCNLYRERCRDYSLGAVLDTHLELVYDAFGSMSEVEDPLSFAQAQLLVALACFYNHELFLGRNFFRGSIRTVRQYSIRFIPKKADSAPLPEFSEEMQERVSFLCELLHSAVEIPLLMGKLDDPLLDLSEQFWHEFLPAYPQASRICSIVVRAVARTFATEIADVFTSYSQQRIPTSTCLSSCFTQLSNCVRELRNIYHHLEDCKSRNDQITYFSLSFSLAIMKVTLVEISTILERHPLNLDSQSKLCDAAVETVEGMLEGVPPDDIQLVWDICQVGVPRGISIFRNKERVRLATDPLAPKWPVAQPESSFWDANVTVMALCQQKIATVRIDKFPREWSED